MKNWNSKKDLDLQLKQYIIAKDIICMCFLPPMKYALCYAHMKPHCPKSLQSKCEVVTPKGCVAILIYFIFWGQPVNYWSVFCSFND